ncbi:MAG TPA: tetratricopeptide repeat protein [Blastocatellia bacterium]|nr:tetratricopeptide repeat protein [Blastocatellia bacterium]
MLTVIALFGCGAPVFAQRAAPTLPQLALETYPPAAREPLSRAHKEASARPNAPDAVCGLARALHAWEQWEGAHQAYDRCQSLAPATFDWAYLDALVLQRIARHEAAALEFRQALRLNPEYLPARIRLAESLFEAGQLGESRDLFAALSQEPAVRPAAELGLGRVAAAEGQHDRAITHLERAVALYPEFGAAYYALALSYRTLARTDDARRALDFHARYGPRWPAVDDPVRAKIGAVRDDASANLQRGISLAESGDLRGAVEAHEAALARDASHAQAHANLIKLYGRVGDWKKAEEHYKAVIALGVNLTEAHYDYGVLLGLREEWELAAKAYRAALAANPLHAQARNNLGQILERERRFEAAAEEYRQATASQPEFRLARFNLGRVLLRLGRIQQAIDELEELVQPRDSEAPQYLFALAVAHLRAGHTSEGIRWANEARGLALEHGQLELAAAIERDLAKVK